MNNNEKVSFENTAYQQLKQAIIRGIYPPGSQIIEELIATQLNMSRSPVRGAIKRLEAEGFLDKRANRRMYVTHGNAKRTLDALYIRKALEGASAYQAALNHTDEDIAAIQAILNQMKDYCDNDDSFNALRLGTDIHKAIYQATKNNQLITLGINVLEQVSLFGYKSLRESPSRIHESFSEHAALAEAIFAGDCLLAEQKARDHVEVLIKRVLRHYDEEQNGPPLLIQY